MSAATPTVEVFLITPDAAVQAAEISIGFRIGTPCQVLFTVKIGDAKKTTAIEPDKFLEQSGLGHFFFQLRPEFKQMLKNERAKVKRRAAKGKS